MTMTPHANVFAAPALAAAVFGLSGLLGGCASKNIQAEWADPEFAGRSLRGEKVLVVCNAAETSIERVCQDQLARQVAAAGGVPVTSPEPEAATAAADKALEAARNLGAKAVLVATVAPEGKTVNPGPRVGIGVGGGFGGGYRTSGVGVGVTMPIGTSKTSTAYAADVVLTDAASGRLMWTAKVTAPASQDVNGQIGQLAKAGVEAVQKAGFL
jgi:hypothetical protein